VDTLKTPGTYALVLACSNPIRIRVGALGEVGLDAGYLVYVGSAFGPGGLAGRLRHHLRPVRRPRWHVDYLREQASLVGVWCASGPRSLEHEWATAFANIRGFTAPHRGLGASDCACDTHLLHSRRRPTGRWIRESLAGAQGATPVDFFRINRLQVLVDG